MKLRYLKNVATLRLETEKCIGCGRCAEVCPHGVFCVDEKKARIEDKDLCMECGACAKNCPAGAVSVKAGVGCAAAVIKSRIDGRGSGCDCSCGDECC